MADSQDVKVGLPQNEWTEQENYVWEQTTHGAIANLIDAAVADVRPECATFLNETNGAGCARPEVNR